MLWWIGAVLVAGLVASLALSIAISRNGPATLTAIDRITGGSGGAEIKAAVSTGESPAQKLVVWGPSQSSSDDSPLPVLVFVHGGSWKSGDPDDYGFIGRSFVPKGFIVVLAGYRLHPEAVYPAMLQDTAQAIAWAHREVGRFGGDPARITLVGHSAGAYNVVMNALEPRWLANEGLSTDNLAGVIGLSGPYDFFPFDSPATQDSFGSAEYPEDTQPIAQVRGDAPPMLLIHGEQDTLVKPRNSKALHNRVVDAGGTSELITMPDMKHNDPLIALASPWRSKRTVRDEILRFAENVVTEPTTSVPVQSEMR